MVSLYQGEGNADALHGDTLTVDSDKNKSKTTTFRKAAPDVQII